jgi:hypothetical protein
MATQRDPDPDADQSLHHVTAVGQIARMLSGITHQAAQRIEANEALADERFRANMQAAQAANYARFQTIFALIRYGLTIMGHNPDRSHDQ